MPTLPNMNLITPVQGGDSGTWDDKINAAFALVDAHNHTSGKGVRVPVAGLNINADLPMGSHGITGVGLVDFTPVATLAAGANVLYVDVNDGELYYRTTGGSNTKLTSGSTLNISLVGGIAGDYSAVGAEVAYDDTNKRYTFKDQSSPTRKWVRLASGPVRIYEYNSTAATYIELVSPAALAASYTVKFAGALPGAQTMVQIAADGTLVYSNTLANNTNIVLQGTGKVTHGTWNRTFDIHPTIVTTGSVSGGTDGGAGFGSSIMAVSTVMYSRIDGFLATDTLTSLIIGCQILTGASLTFDLLQRDEFGALTSVLAAPTTSTTLTPTGPVTQTAGRTMYLKATTNGSTTAALYTARATFTG